MTTPPSDGELFAARLLEQGASGLAGFAASLLLEEHPEVEERYAPDAMQTWKGYFRQRLLELAAAVQAGETPLFTARLEWARQAHVARGQQVDDLILGLQALSRVLGEHLPEAARSLPQRMLEEARTQLQQTEPTLDEEGLDPEDPYQRRALEYLHSILEGKGHQAIDDVLTLVQEGASPLDVYLEILLPAQREIGRLWHRGEVNIAEEHLVTSTTERAQSVLVHSAPAVEPNGRTVVAAAVAGDQHDIGLRAVSDAYQLAGWRTLFLGRNMPPRDLAEALGFFDADLLLLTATLTTHLPRVRDTIEAVRQHSGPDVRILVGGATFDESPDLWEKVGADAHAPTIREALDVGARLVGLD